MNNKNISLKNISIFSWLLMITYISLFVILFYPFERLPFQKETEITPNPIGFFIKPFWAERHYREGYNLGINKRYDFAIEEIERAIKLTPWETTYRSHLNKILIEYLNKNINKNRKKSIIFYKLGVSNCLENLKLNPINPWFHFRIASFYEFAKTLFPEEKAHFLDLEKTHREKASKNDNKNPLFLINYADFLFKQEQYRKAIPLYETAVKYDSRFTNATYSLGKIYKKLNQPSKALENFTKVYEVNTNNVLINISIADIHIENNQHRLAIPYLQKALEVDPDNLHININTAALYYQLQEWTLAASIYRKLLSSSPSLFKYYKFFIPSLVNSNQIKEAKQVIRYVLKQPQLPADEKKKIQHFKKELAKK